MEVENWGGTCSVHHLSLPCPVCTSAPMPNLPTTPYVGDNSPNYDPWMWHQYQGPLTPLPPTPKYGYSFTPDVCDHCFCEESSTHWNVPKPDHETCCNCGVSRLKAPFGGVEDGWEFEQGKWDHEVFSDD